MTMTTVKPLGNRVVVERSKVKKTKWGILLPDTAQEKPKEGKVIAAGPGKINDDGELEPTSVKVGDSVLFGSYAGTPITVEGTISDSDEGELLILSEDEILGILD